MAQEIFNYKRIKNFIILRSMIQIISRFISIHRFDLEDFRYNNVNMTAFRLVDADNEEVQQLLYEMETLSPLGAAILNKSQVM